jgi:hypothetical protein
MMEKLEINTINRLGEGVHWAHRTEKFIVRAKKNGRMTTLAAFKEKKDAENYLQMYLKGEIK